MCVCVCGVFAVVVVVVVVLHEASRTVLNASVSMDRGSMLADQNRRGDFVVQTEEYC